MRCQNCNRRPKAATGGDGTKPKRAKTDRSDKHVYPSLTGSPDDDVSNERNIRALKDQMAKSKLNHGTIQELIKRTFYQMRIAILDDPNPKSVEEICETYPVLKKAVP